MNQTNDLVRDVNLIIKICERKATEDNMTEQQKKECNSRWRKYR